MLKIIHNVSTGQITEREMTADEIAAVEAAQAKAQAEAAEAAAKEAARQALLEKLGITADEAKLLLG
jgi:phosphopantetheinyl transferase (holo-ACP synthase)